MPYKDKEAKKVARRKHYLKNKSHVYNKMKDRRKRLVEFLRNIKKTVVCSKCNEGDWRCLDFHHKNPKEKLFKISDVHTHGCSEEKILTEIRKCEILCSNCHRKHHMSED